MRNVDHERRHIELQYMNEKPMILKGTGDASGRMRLTFFGNPGERKSQFAALDAIGPSWMLTLNGDLEQMGIANGRSMDSPDSIAEFITEKRNLQSNIATVSHPLLDHRHSPTPPQPRKRQRAAEILAREDEEAGSEEEMMVHAHPQPPPRMRPPETWQTKQDQEKETTSAQRLVLSFDELWGNIQELRRAEDKHGKPHSRLRFGTD
ncbi:hypothetical protein BJ875DRAFT_482451 [Amylocarpus encephaloides]|uniref:Uncharacterized protein n=1 Tax=Amylocarpus encephaloides TaxID=45428 RepID=A0A9P8C7H4_9HELO|nr:hypothetical protein BJ875DRAFT_482451 [Amylocarpus encephaloides]